MKKLKLVKLIILISTLIEFNSCTKGIGKGYGLPNNFHKLWVYDTCGMKGIRLNLISDLKRKKENQLFIGASQKEIINLFGNPDKEDSNEWLNYYWYNLSAVEKEGNECGLANIESLYIIFDKNKKKVIEFSTIIH